MERKNLLENSNLVKVEEDIGQAIKEYLELVGHKISKEDAIRFINICKAFNLNPFKREIYLIPYGNQANIIVGYEVYLKRAERSGKLSGWRVWTEGSIQDGSLKACVEIRRKDWDSSFYHEVYFTEYNQNNSIWKSKPITMIKKVAIAQAFRLCFPEEVGGMPYIEEEIEPVQAEIIEEDQNKEENSWTREKIAEIASEELKKVVKEHKIKTKELIELFERFDGDQAKIIKAIKEKEEQND